MKAWFFEDSANPTLSCVGVTYSKSKHKVFCIYKHYMPINLTMQRWIDVKLETWEVSSVSVPVIISSINPRSGVPCWEEMSNELIILSPVIRLMHIEEGILTDTQ